MTKEQLLSLLNSYRKEAITEKDVVQSIKDDLLNIDGFLKRNSYLKLKRGNPLPACLELLPTCNKCIKIFNEGDFNSYADFERCDDSVKKNRSLNNIEYASESRYSILLPQRLGGVAFFKCCHCGSVWQIILPERAQKGSWSRIA